MLYFILKGIALTRRYFTYRLDEQHTLFVDTISGENSTSPIHTSISRKDVKSVADVATGTG